MREFELTQPVGPVSEPTLVPIGGLEQLESHPRPPIIRRPAGESLPLSFAQRQVWLHAQLAPDVPLYNQVLILEHTGPFDREALERSLSEIARRHETLRTTFPIVDGTPTQVIARHQA